MTVGVSVAVALRAGRDGDGEGHHGTRRDNGQSSSDRHYCAPACVVDLFLAVGVGDDAVTRRSTVACVSARSVSIGAFAVLFTA